MTDKKPEIGAIEWRDLTVDNADQVSDFYQNVVGWKKQGAAMGDYEDFNMNLPESGDTVAGVCHARGFNEGLPAQWLIYVRVASIAQSMQQCEANGGKVVFGPKSMGSNEFCVIEDPAGASMALIADKPAAD